MTQMMTLIQQTNNREDTVEGVENNGDDSTTNEPTTADIVRFFFGVFDADLPTFVFLRGALLFFAMVIQWRSQPKLLEEVLLLGA
jgi:hypothetical protein